MDDRTLERRAFNALLATDLLAFLQRAFRDLDPRNQLLIAPFVELLTEELQQVADELNDRPRKTLGWARPAFLITDVAIRTA